VAAVLEAIAGALRSGSGFVPSVAVAVRDAHHPFASGLRRVVDEVGTGGGLDAALARWAARDGGPWAAAVTDACTVGLEMGVGLAEALDRVAQSARAEASLADDVHVLTAPARASAALMAAMPFGFALFVVAPDAQLRAFLFGSRAGLMCVSLALVAELLGAAWMRALVGAVR
jgi:tight adherence protein B